MDTRKFNGLIDELDSTEATLINILAWTEPPESPYYVDPSGEEMKKVSDWVSIPLVFL